MQKLFIGQGKKPVALMSIKDSRAIAYTAPCSGSALITTVFHAVVAVPVLQILQLDALCHSRESNKASDHPHPWPEEDGQDRNEEDECDECQGGIDHWLPPFHRGAYPDNGTSRLRQRVLGGLASLG